MKVTLTGYAPNKRIMAIKAVRTLTSFGLKEAKEVVDTIQPRPEYDFDAPPPASKPATISINPRPGYPVASDPRFMQSIRAALDEGTLTYEPFSQPLSERVSNLPNPFKSTQKWLSGPHTTLQTFVQPMPIYVTRKTADGYTGSYTLPGWQALLMVLIITFNIIGWGLYGLVDLIAKVV